MPPREGTRQGSPAPSPIAMNSLSYDHLRLRPAYPGTAKNRQENASRSETFCMNRCLIGRRIAVPSGANEGRLFIAMKPFRELFRGVTNAPNANLKWMTG